MWAPGGDAAAALLPLALLRAAGGDAALAAHAFEAIAARGGLAGTAWWRRGRARGALLLSLLLERVAAAEVCVSACLLRHAEPWLQARRACAEDRADALTALLGTATAQAAALTGLALSGYDDAVRAFNATHAEACADLMRELGAAG
ncbi:hypothetical protein JKP88DRAFT_267728 [Tribonema minus]|uniref:Uncharacterized protein n=1 Tax=Tribonema minus TaxID=303371 RepID=A0A835Z5Z9_9STRA|nr:hypothetical protein JKP88DRAFT_267728 [Tribonema minus]